MDFVYPCDFDSEDALSDADHNQCLRPQFGSHIQSYPVDASKVARAQPGGAGYGPDSRAPAAKDSTCPGCRHFRSKDDWEHTREIGQCRYPYDEPWIPDCVACQDRKPRHHAEHTYESRKCKWATAPLRSTAPRARRRSARPHEPEPKPEQEPTAGIPANVEGRELGADGEEQIAREDRAAEPSASSSGGRGPDREPRERRTYRDQGDNPEAAHDWSNFDIGRVVRIFRTKRESAIRLSLRKLHVRWWHASEHTMKRFLQHVGVEDRVLDLIPEIVHTCSVCRQWAKLGPSNACSVDLADAFNQQVECDLLRPQVYHLPYVGPMYKVARCPCRPQQRGRDPY